MSEHQPSHQEPRRPLRLAPLPRPSRKAAEPAPARDEDSAADADDENVVEAESADSGADEPQTQPWIHEWNEPAAAADA